MSNCTFCNLINGKINGYKIFEDDYTIACLDIAKDVDYHILVIPKKHVHNILDCDDKTLNNVMKTLKKISNYCVDELGFDGVNILNAANEAAGQSIQHFHIHLIPRKNNDGIDAWPKFKGSNADLNEISKIFKCK